MKITLIQTRLHWEDREKNLSHFDHLIGSLTEKTDVIVLPEMFTTGFTMNPEKQAEPLGAITLDWMRQKAKENQSVLTGSVAVEENGKYYNRLFWVEADGNVSRYDKRHLFRMANEDQHYTAGDKKIIKRVGDWNVCPLICYDLRFPVWSRNAFRKTSEQKDLNGSWDYDVLIYVANWPEVRNYPWKHLLIARAIENQCYVVGVNRIGSDGNGYAHSGDSVIVNPRGEIISKTEANEESVETLILDRNYLEEYRRVFPVGWDADAFKLG